ncbi:hypothetical protein [Paenibacillus xylaniclasticus]|uniref:hypothetical protein n=1 Tax=Paenibacillus xylaniclasticus TaxID=588083 RepID=UPI0013E03D0A|nr:MULTISPECIES: hypothetical protein [Paenibacillus]GFN31196.1 hypothetical protein PCURB6_14560 [Paenibacillus curdlanolyticus]
MNMVDRMRRPEKLTYAEWDNHLQTVVRTDSVWDFRQRSSFVVGMVLRQGLSLQILSS